MKYFVICVYILWPNNYCNFLSVYCDFIALIYNNSIMVLLVLKSCHPFQQGIAPSCGPQKYGYTLSLFKWLMWHFCIKVIQGLRIRFRSVLCIDASLVTVGNVCATDKHLVTPSKASPPWLTDRAMEALIGFRPELFDTSLMRRQSATLLPPTHPHPTPSEKKNPVVFPSGDPWKRGLFRRPDKTNMVQKGSR